MTQTRTRMAPSPTGEYHIGHIRTLLYNWALAKGSSGKFVLRIEDTDRERYSPGAEQRIMKVIKDYGLNWDEGPDIGGPYAPYKQSARLPIYKEWAEKLIAGDKAYYCFCSKERLEKLRQEQIATKQQPRYDGHCRNLTKDEVAQRLQKKEPFVIRLKVPHGEKIEFTDLVRGKITVDSDSLDDQVLLKSDGFPTYHLGVVVDDILMKISHIIRGEEWLSSTPKHILLYKAFGFEPPVFAHVTVLLDPSGKGKMSKRKGSVSARSFLDEGFLPEAILNFLMLLGWAPKDDREIFALDEFAHQFSLEGLQVASPIFDRQKLAWFNGYYIRQKGDESLVKLLKPFAPPEATAPELARIAPLVKERIEKLSDFIPLAGFFWQKPSLSRDLFSDPNTRAHLTEALSNLSKLSNWATDSLNQSLQPIPAQNGWKTGDFFMSLRLAVSGSRVTPPLSESLEILGKEETLSRLHQAENILK